MWDLPQLVQIRQARQALRSGRLDEAFSIVSDRELREFKQCQDLLDELARDLLARAREHLEADRVDDALADIGKAGQISGNRGEVAELRDAALKRLRSNRRDDEAARAAIRSVHRHLDAGRPDLGAERLAQIAPERSEAKEAARRLERQRLLADQARQAIQTALEDDDLAAALEAATRLDTIARCEPQSAIILRRLGKACEEALTRAVRDGGLTRATEIGARACGLDLPGLRAAHWRELLAEVEKAATSVARADWARASVQLRRVLELEPGAEWARRAEDQVAQVETGLRGLSASPLGRLSSFRRARPSAVATAPAAASPAEPAPGRRRTKPGADRRLVLWIDGVGSYLLLTGDRITIGRDGSSAAPDLAVPGNIDGQHAHIERVEGDYFVCASSDTYVAGRPITRHLLADSDEIRLGARVRLRFRIPTSLSGTAVLDLEGSRRMTGDIRHVVLVDGHVILGGDTSCHVETPATTGRIILTLQDGGLRCRAPEGVIVDGMDAGNEAELPIGARVAVGPISFTVTPFEGRSASI